MPDTLLETKLFVPSVRPEIVSRPRLKEKINDGLHRKLTLISAPAGFGKSTLVGDWMSQTDLPIAWLSLDERDSDPVRFIRYFVAALSKVDVFDSGFLEKLSSVVDVPQVPPIENILTLVINEVAGLSEKVVLVLDDYHLIESDTIFKATTFLLENLPAQLHLLIITRIDPNIPIVRLRARDQLTELRAVDLRFSVDEVSNFLNQVMGLELTDSEIQALEERTEGWITGLQMAAISMRGTNDVSSFIESFTGSHRLVLDYLIEEVLNQQSENIQKFLLQTSIADCLSDSLCNAITGMENSQEILEQLDNSNLFVIPLDNHRQWYRYHHLFVDLLTQRLRITQPDQIPLLHLRASDWFQENSFGEDAITHAILGAEYPQAADLIEEIYGGNYEQISSPLLRRWLAAIPNNIICEETRLCLLHAWNQFTSGQLTDSDHSLQLVRGLLEKDVQITGHERNTLAGRADGIRSFIASYGGDLTKAVEFAQRALDVLPVEEASWRSASQIALGDAYAAMGKMKLAQKIRAEALESSKLSGDPFIHLIANLNLAETIWLQGEIKQVNEICSRLEHFVEKQELQEATITGWLYGIWGEVLAELNLMDQALEFTKKGVEIAETREDVTYLCYSLLHRVRVLFSSGYLDEADTVLNRMERLALDYDLPVWASSQRKAWQVRIWLAQGNLGAATEWAKERGLTLEDEIPFLLESEYLAMTRVWLANGQFEEAETILEQIHIAADLGGRILRLVEVYLLKALLAQASGHVPQAMTYLEEAALLSKSKGFVRIFVDEGTRMAKLLYEAVSYDFHTDFIQKLLAGFPEVVVKSRQPERLETPDGEYIEPLSDRELEVLQLMAEGLTNPEIGKRLFLSPNTVKAHSRTIYSKLGVNNRTQAVNRARALGIMADP